MSRHHDIFSDEDLQRGDAMTTTINDKHCYSCPFSRLLVALVLFAASGMFAVPATAKLSDCGQPVSLGFVKATDSAYVNQAAVGSKPCPLCLCDVDNSGAIAATDTLHVLRAAVGSESQQDFTCHTGSECVACTTSAIESAIENLSDNDRLTDHSSILFSCNSWDGPIDITESWGDVQVSASNVDIGAEREFQLSPRCYNRCLGSCTVGGTDCTQDEECSSGTCEGSEANGLANPRNCTHDSDCNGYGNGICSSDTCPDVNAGGRRFLEITGDDVVIKEVTVRGFFDGLVASGNNATIEDVTLERQCDESFATGQTGFSNVLQRATITYGCDKCTQLNQGGSTMYNPGATPRPSQCALPMSSSDPDPNRGCYHVSILDSELEGCTQPLRVAPGTTQGNGGKFYFRDVTISEVAGATDYPTDQFACFRSFFDASDVVGDFVDFESSGCDIGLALEGENSKFTLDGIDRSMIALSDKKGLEVHTSGDSDSIKVRNTDILDNAGFAETDDPVGGVAINSGTAIDLGNNGAADPGYNRLCCNKAIDGMLVDRQIHNASGLAINARGNYWCDVTPAVENEAGTGSTTNTSNAKTDTSMTCTSR
jgi:hypothetical protein